MRLTSPAAYPAPEPRVDQAPMGYGPPSGHVGYGAVSKPPDPQASLAATVQSAPPIPAIQIPPVESAASLSQAPLPQLEPGVSRFPSTITIKLPKVRREYLIAVASVVATLAVVGILFRATRPEESRVHGEPLAGDNAKTAPTGTATTTTATTATATATVTATAAPTPTATTAVVSATATTTATAPPAPTTFSIGALPTATSTPTVGGPMPVATAPSPKPVEEKPAPTTTDSGGTGTISIVCKPACDAVFLRTRNLGPSPIIGLSLPAGTYPVTLKRSGSPNQQTVITVTAGKNTPLRVNM